MGIDLCLVVLTDRHQAGERGVAATAAAAVAGGARTVILREKDLGPHLRDDLGRALVRILAPVGGELILAGSDGALARRVGAVGLHLSGTDPIPADRSGLTLGRSCHGVDEVAAAGAAGLDYVSLSPVFTSASKPGYGPPLGLDGLAEVVSSTSMPILALGGVGPAQAPGCLGAGAAGVAVMGAVMAATDPITATRALLEAIASGGLGW